MECHSSQFSPTVKLFCILLQSCILVNFTGPVFDIVALSCAIQSILKRKFFYNNISFLISEIIFAIVLDWTSCINYKRQIFLCLIFLGVSQSTEAGWSLYTKTSLEIRRRLKCT